MEGPEIFTLEGAGSNPVDSTKQCSKCKETKPLSSFSRRFNDYQAWCKACSKEHKRIWINNNRNKIKLNALWSTYRLRPNDYLNLLIKQDFKCAICKSEIPTHVDHDHKCCAGSTSCGKCVRGLLCKSCNIMLGMIETNTNKIKNVIEYLSLVMD